LKKTSGLRDRRPITLVVKDRQLCDFRRNPSRFIA